MSQRGQDRPRQGRSDDAHRGTSNGPRERPLERIDGGAHPVPSCPKLKGIRQKQVRQWLLDRETYEEDLRAVCMRRNLEVRNCCEGWKECFEDKRLLKQFMIKRKLRGDPKELDETVLETELRKIFDEPKDGVEADIPLLFHGIHLDMKDNDVFSRVCKFLADCDERIEACVMKGHLKKPEMRKKIFKRLLEVVDPEPVRDACVLDMEKAWHPVEFTWESISELVMHHAQEQQPFLLDISRGTEEQEKSREAKPTEPEKKKLRRMLESPAGESVATINGVLDVPYCPDNGSDVGIISTATVKTLRKLDETVQAKQLPKAWVGSAVGNLPVVAKTTVELRLFYVVDDNDELIISKYALMSIGLDMDRLLEQVAVHQTHEDGDDIGDPGEAKNIAFVAGFYDKSIG
ncbi:hypothetical protein H257_04164 [Aphanomyces astaci]|uniref:Uncharacterized protein n=1 Tax=Aphanomyces astaci TaxID=112090 RepID=W4GUS1_APHAT|nr:hypothetical protein H257_04164 [Aphanomyces astaci]ETV83437.1 hypothetical protein H257_04164 [Aphanomyces astaci]|eukprot:XP_009826867.1 hypothetical protein H257_04164 [Aphanomyces astaci]